MEANKKCEKILSMMLCHESAGPLLQPPQADHPNYSGIMNDYLDLTIIDKKFKSGHYYGTFSFIQDVRKVLSRSTLIQADTKELS